MDTGHGTGPALVSSPGLSRGVEGALVDIRGSRDPAMTDVARLAGVSHQTVSRVLNDHPNVKEQTRLRVRAAIAELGYRPNRAARTLVTGRSQLIGLVTVDQVAGAKAATRHLLAAGHPTVWHISGPAQWYDAAGRIEGWRQALIEAGAEVPPLMPADWS